jgi:hypothetical protein
MTTQHTTADPIQEAFAEHRKVLAQRDELVAALQAMLNEYAKDKCNDLACDRLARATLAKVQK